MAAKKKKAKKKAAAKPAKKAKKAAAKPKKKKAAAKKAASPKKQKKKKAAAPKKAAAKPAEAVKAVKAAEAPGEFPATLKHLEEVVNGGQAGEMDFEMYQSFNEQYKPSDWTRNPKSDDELWAFGMDGSGGQVALWRTEPGVNLEDRPVVMLGSEGEVSPIASDLPSFLYLVANGVGPMEVLFDMVEWDEVQGNDEMLEWVSSQWPKRTFPEPKKIISDAKSKYKHFEKHLRAQCPAD